MQTPNIQNNKYTPGPLPGVCAPRTALLARLGQGAKTRLAFLCAPAGFGKTVTALLWLRQAGRQPVWVGLDALDDSPSVFYRMFCTGILAAQPDNPRMAVILHSPAFASAPVEHTVNLLAEFWQDGREYALVLDDFHAVTNLALLKSLPLILRRLPHSFVTLVLSRTEPGDTFADLVQAGQAAVLGPKELAFTGAEIADYFAALGRGLSQEEAQAALDFTGGWAIGVNALAHSAGPTPDGTGGQVLECYITRHIWAEWDDGLRAFLLASAALDEMPVPLCAAVTGRKDAGELLEDLRAQNAFVARVEDGVYRYHHLFLDFLRTQPEYLAADHTQTWRAAARHYMAQNEHLVSRHYSYASGDTKTIMDTLYEFMENRGFSIDEYLDTSQAFFTSPSIEALCEKCPVLYISCVWVAFLTGDAAGFEKNEDLLRKNLPVILLRYPKFGEVAFSLIAMDYRTPFAKQIAQAALLPPISVKGDSLRAASMSLQMPFVHRSCRDFNELTDKSLYAKLKKTFGKLLKSHYKMIMHDISAGLALEQDKPAEALTEAEAGVALLGLHTAKEMRFAAYMHLAAAHLALGNAAELTDVLEEAGRFVDDEAQFLRPNFLAFAARIKLWDCDEDAAREWLAHYFVTDSPRLAPHRLYQYFTTARALSVLGEVDKAKDLAARLRRLGQEFNRPLDAAEAAALLAALQWAGGQKQEAQETMEAVLLELQPRGFVRVIADEGTAVAPVLKKVLAKIERPDYAGALDRFYVSSVYLAAYALGRQRAGITAGLSTKPVKLSKQQKHILQLLAQGYRREDIITKTGLSLNTVKSHIRLAYGKLGAASAAEAVARARELGVME